MVKLIVVRYRAKCCILSDFPKETFWCRHLRSGLFLHLVEFQVDFIMLVMWELGVHCHFVCYRYSLFSIECNLCEILMVPHEAHLRWSRITCDIGVTISNLHVPSYLLRRDFQSLTINNCKTVSPIIWPAYSLSLSYQLFLSPGQVGCRISVGGV